MKSLEKPTNSITNRSGMLFAFAWCLPSKLWKKSFEKPQLKLSSNWVPPICFHLNGDPKQAFSSFYVFRFVCMFLLWVIVFRASTAEKLSPTFTKLFACLWCDCRLCKLSRLSIFVFHVAFLNWFSLRLRRDLLESRKHKLHRVLWQSKSFGSLFAEINLFFPAVLPIPLFSRVMFLVLASHHGRKASFVFRSFESFPRFYLFSRNDFSST